MKFNDSPLGSFTCTGYNNLANGDTPQTATSTLDIIITEDVQVTLSASPVVAVGGEMEASFGDTVTIRCVAEGGRTPHYMVWEENLRESIITVC